MTKTKTQDNGNGTELGSVRVVFVQRENGPERLLSEAEMAFLEGPLSGMKLVGFSLWQGADGDVYVTFPSRSAGAGTERRYFDYLRSSSGETADVKRVKAWIVEAFKARQAAAA